jgi:hypothetical protein
VTAVADRQKRALGLSGDCELVAIDTKDEMMMLGVDGEAAIGSLR